MIASITIDRGGLSLPDLVIDNNPFGSDFHLPEDGIGRPNFAMRRGYAPTSRLIGGQQLLSAVSDIGSLSLRIYAHGTDTADLDTNRAALSAALTQWAFQLTLTVDGSSETYWCDPEFPSWGPVDLGEAAAFMSVASVTVPVQPGSA